MTSKTNILMVNREYLEQKITTELDLHIENENSEFAQICMEILKYIRENFATNAKIELGVSSKLCRELRSIIDKKLLGEESSMENDSTYFEANNEVQKVYGKIKSELIDSYIRDFEAKEKNEQILKELYKIFHILNTNEVDGEKLIEALPKLQEALGDQYLDDKEFLSLIYFIKPKKNVIKWYKNRENNMRKSVISYRILEEIISCIYAYNGNIPCDVYYIESVKELEKLLCSKNITYKILTEELENVMNTMNEKSSAIIYNFFNVSSYLSHFKNKNSQLLPNNYRKKILMNLQEYIQKHTIN